MNRLAAGLLLTALPALLRAADAPAPAAPAPPVAPPAAAASAGPRPESMSAYFTGEDGTPAKAPLFADGSRALPIAKVGGEPIALSELMTALGTAHDTMTKEVHAGGKDFKPVLDRLIDVKLVLLEAREMGLADQPEVKKAVEGYVESATIQELQKRALVDVKPDPAEVEKIRRIGVKEGKVQSVLFKTEADAKAFAAAAKKSGFDASAKAAVASGKATGGKPAEFVPLQKLLGPVANALEKMKKGEVSKPVKIPEGFTVLELEDIRYPANAAALATAREIALDAARKRAIQKYYDGLVARYVKTDKALLKRLDFQAKKPGFAALEKDQRVLSRVEGGAPLTVAELTTTLKEQFYHGVDSAIREKKVNRQKLPTLDAILSRRVLPLEAKRLGIPESPAFKKGVADYTDKVVFTSFVEKVVLPEVKVPDAEQQKYYEAHKAEYTLPAFYKLESIAFPDVKRAQAALQKLQSGTDFAWLRANAEGQVKEVSRGVKFEGGTVSAKAMPEELAKLLANAKAGDYRLYSGEGDQHHVVHVLQVTPPEVKSFAQAQDGIHQKLYADHLNASIRQFSDKLRQAHPVKVYLKKIGS